MNKGSRRYDTRTTVASRRRLSRFPLLAAGLLSLFAVSVTPSDAGACVAEVYERTETVKVSAHETAMTMTHAGSSMWFRLEFAGNPKDFGVLIPVAKGATLNLGAPEFFDTLRSMTTPQVKSVVAGTSRGGCGCGSALDGVAGEGGDAGVTVVEAANVGPYATVTLRATDPDALGKWLDANGFVIDEAVKAAAASYVAEGMDFIAVKFRAGATTTKMPPIRVDTDTHDMRVLLRMAQSGAGTTTDMVLYVLGTQRMRPQNFPETTVDAAKITVDASGKSNYDVVARERMGEGEGRTWITEFAGLMDGSSYEAACRAQRTTGQQPVVNPLEPDAADAADAADVSDATGVLDAAPDGALPDGGVDAANVPDAEPSQEDAGTDEPTTGPDLPLACSSEDLFRRFPGAGSIYVTRLRASLPRAALAEDLMLEEHPKTDDVPRTLIVGGKTNASIAGFAGGESGTFLLVGATALGLAVLKRRSRRA